MSKAQRIGTGLVAGIAAVVLAPSAHAAPHSLVCTGKYLDVTQLSNAIWFDDALQAWTGTATSYSRLTPNGWRVITGGGLIGTTSNDVISGSGARDVINGGPGDDTLCGHGGNDDIRGGLGNDFMYGGAGDDYMDGGDGNDLMHGGAGNDILRGGAGNDKIDGGTGADKLIGGDGLDVVSRPEGTTGEYSKEFELGTATGSTADAEPVPASLYGALPTP